MSALGGAPPDVRTPSPAGARPRTSCGSRVPLRRLRLLASSRLLRLRPFLARATAGLRAPDFQIVADADDSLAAIAATRKQGLSVSVLPLIPQHLEPAEFLSGKVDQ